MDRHSWLIVAAEKLSERSFLKMHIPDHLHFDGSLEETGAASGRFFFGIGLSRIIISCILPSTEW